jgi:hypothetical protein
MTHHHCECQHERVKYCPVCRVVYCEDCRREWVERGWNFTTYPYTTPYPYWTYTQTVSPSTAELGSTTSADVPTTHTH